MFAFFDQIGNFFSSLIGFIIHFFDYMKLFFTMIGKSMMFIAELAMSLPEPVVMCFLTLVCVSVIYLVVGR